MFRNPFRCILRKRTPSHNRRLRRWTCQIDKLDRTFSTRNLFDSDSSAFRVAHREMLEDAEKKLLATSCRVSNQSRNSIGSGSSRGEASRLTVIRRNIHLRPRRSTCVAPKARFPRANPFSLSRNYGRRRQKRVMAIFGAGFILRKPGIITSS
jgi:hypothetical protein